MELIEPAPKRIKRTTNTQPPQVRRWLLRMLVNMGVAKSILGSHRLRMPDSMVRALGLQHWEEQEKPDPVKFRRELQARLARVEKDPTAHRPATPLHKNCQRLRKLVGLSESDAAILEFAVCVHTIRSLDDCCDLLEQMNHVQLTQSLAAILNLPHADVASSLSSQGLLAKSGLVRVDHSTILLRGKLDLIGSKFANALASSETDLIMLLRGIVNRATPGKLTLADYEHAVESTQIILPYLKRAKSEGRRGVNILLFGPPGTGKTELVKAIGNELGFEMYEVAYEDDDGDPVDAEARLRAYRAAQCFFGKQNALLLFDEIEDVFNDSDGLFSRRSTAQKRKAWINRTLETNPIPTMWVSNSIHHMDPAVLRRFDMVMELPVPPFRKRVQIAKDHCGDLLPAESVERIARVEALAPAVVARATSVIRLIREDLGEQKCPAAVERLINGTLEAQHHRPLQQQDANRLPAVYDPGLIAADAELAHVAAGLNATKSGRLCLYGPPGTGKTAFGHYLAELMEVPLIVKRASDLLGRFVGENEKNVAGAFADATRDGAILLIDEVDSFLRDRRGAQRGWEAILVNEMLTQMESFNGIFIASTNLMDNLDPASLRRFDLKVKFDYLRPEQALKLFLRYCQLLGIALTEVEDGLRLRRLTQLTPGDFAAVFRRHRFHPVRSAAQFVAALAGECEVKEVSARRIGFVH